MNNKALYLLVAAIEFGQAQVASAGTTPKTSPQPTTEGVDSAIRGSEEGTEVKGAGRAGNGIQKRGGGAGTKGKEPGKQEKGAAKKGKGGPKGKGERSCGSDMMKAGGGKKR